MPTKDEIELEKRADRQSGEFLEITNSGDSKKGTAKKAVKKEQPPSP